MRTRPSAKDYRQLRILTRGDVIRPVALRGVEIAVKDFLPRRRKAH